MGVLTDYFRGTKGWAWRQIGLSAQHTTRGPRKCFSVMLEPPSTVTLKNSIAHSLQKVIAKKKPARMNSQNRARIKKAPVVIWYFTTRLPEVHNLVTPNAHALLQLSGHLHQFMMCASAVSAPTYTCSTGTNVFSHGSPRLSSAMCAPSAPGCRGF